MVQTPSSMLPLGTVAPQFTLPDSVTGKKIALNECVGGKGILIAFICNHCPFVTHIILSLSQSIREYHSLGIPSILISANDVLKYPDDSPEKMKEFAKRYSLACPYLYDESQEVTKAYRAECTPDFFLFDTTLRLVYRGQYDSSRPGNGQPVTGADLSRAAKALSAGTEISSDQKPSVGCNIKWK